MAATLKANTRQLIIDSTLKLIATRSAESISLGDIAEAAGITKGTLFYYYKSKDLIFVDITEEYLNSLAVRMTEWITNNKKDTSFKRMAKYFIDFGARTGERSKIHVYLVNKAISSDENLRVLFRNTYNEWRSVFKKYISERVGSGVDSNAMADMFLIIIDGLIMQDLVGVEQVDVASIVALLKSE